MTALDRYVRRIVREELAEFGEALRPKPYQGGSIRDALSRVETGIKRLHGLDKSGDDAVQLVHLVPEGSVAAVVYGGGTVKDAVEALRDGHGSSLSVGAGTSTVATADSGGPQPDGGVDASSPSGLTSSPSAGPGRSVVGASLPVSTSVPEQPGGTVRDSSRSVPPRSADNPPG